MDVFQVQGGVAFVVLLVLLAIKAYAFINALSWSEQHYQAAGKLTKTAWALILGIALVAQLLLGVGLVNIAFTVAAIVYLVDVRPALQELGRR